MTIKIQDQISGCIFGGAIGDALGSFYEGKKAEENISYDQPMYLSDDTQMTLATCEAIAYSGKIELENIAQNFVNWYKTGNLTGLGSSTTKALRDLIAGGHWALVGRKGDRAAGNGSAMRISPLAFCLKSLTKKDRGMIRDISRITHHNEEAYAGALSVVLAIQASLTMKWEDQMGLFAYILPNIPDCLLKDRMEIISSDHQNSSLEKIANTLGCSGYVVESVPLAIWGAGHIQKYGFKMLLEKLITVGGDTDTIASIAGQIAGTKIGKSKLPKSLINLIPEKSKVESITQKFISAVI